ncbi:hypothetical protein SCHPADRAFT_911123 [Schizopora paradoxa]|uniref:Uncharacterized protein n=1 Tax=Schizopora paradoxa TaxID=27342 RepID=A0A0H2RKG0_9AGAM|nr:hypothetical protein SCHPADRAFT_911123 [Schizopora paradoxa]
MAFKFEIPCTRHSQCMIKQKCTVDRNTNACLYFPSTLSTTTCILIDRFGFSP